MLITGHELRLLAGAGAVAGGLSIAIGFLLVEVLSLEIEAHETGHAHGWLAGNLLGALSPLVHLVLRRIHPVGSPMLSLAWLGIRLLIFTLLCGLVVAFRPDEAGEFAIFLLVSFFCWYAVEVHILMRDNKFND